MSALEEPRVIGNFIQGNYHVPPFLLPDSLWPVFVELRLLDSLWCYLVNLVLNLERGTQTGQSSGWRRQSGVVPRAGRTGGGPRGGGEVGEGLRVEEEEEMRSSSLRGGRRRRWRRGGRDE